jgi:hypothetical protein
LLDLAQAMILLFGGVVIFYAAKSYRRTRSQAMFLLSLGFAVVTLAAVVAGLVFNFASVDLTTVVTLQAYGQALGFLIIVYSLARAKS